MRVLGLLDWGSQGTTMVAVVRVLRSLDCGGEGTTMGRLRW